MMPIEQFHHSDATPPKHDSSARLMPSIHEMAAHRNIAHARQSEPYKSLPKLELIHHAPKTLEQVRASAKPDTYQQDIRAYFKDQEKKCRELAARAKRTTDAVVTGAVNVGKATIQPFYAAEKFALDTFYDHDAAVKSGADFGNAVGGAIVAGDKLSELAKAYVDKINETHDYAKVGKDAGGLWRIACARWSALSDDQRTEKLSEVGASLGVAWGLSKIHALAKSGALVDTLDELGTAVGEHSERAGQAIAKLFDHLLQPEGDTGLGFKMPIPDSNDQQLEESALQMARHRPDSGFRGDKDLHCPFDERGFRKAHVNSAGDLCPADPSGTYKGRKVEIAEHVYRKKFAEAKSHSPYISVGHEGVIRKYGDGQGLVVDLKELRQAIASGEVKGVRIHEHEEVLRAIQNSNFSSDAKNMLTAFSKSDKEILLEGVVPKRFLKLIWL